MDEKQRRKGSLIDEIPGIGKEKAELIGTYLILGILLGKTIFQSSKNNLMSNNFLFKGKFKL